MGGRSLCQSAFQIKISRILRKKKENKDGCEGGKKEESDREGRKEETKKENK